MKKVRNYCDFFKEVVFVESSVILVFLIVYVYGIVK